MSDVKDAPKGLMQKVFDLVEKVGKRVPHPVIIFLILIAIVLVLSLVLQMAGASVTYQVINPDAHEVETATTIGRHPLAGVTHVVALSRR